MRRSWRLLRSLLPGRSAARLRPQRRPIRLRAENGADRFLVDLGIHRRSARGLVRALVRWHASLARPSLRDPQQLILVEKWYRRRSWRPRNPVQKASETLNARERRKMPHLTSD